MQGHLSAWLVKHELIHRSLGFDYQGIETLQIKPEDWHSIAVIFYVYGYNYLRSQCAYDVAPGGLLASVYHLTRIEDDVDQPEELCIKVFASRRNPRISSIFWVWKSVDFQERESYDMLGISYDNHPRLKRILMPESWIGWPLRVLFARSSRLIPDKANLGFCFPCDGPGRGGTCQVSVWDHVFLGLFLMYNSISVVIFHFSWKMQSDVWGSVSDQGVVTHITGGNFARSSITINGWLRDFLWAQVSRVIQSYGSSLSAYGLFFLGAHFVWAFSLMFLFSGRGYWQELIESIVWAHNKLKVAPATQPRALSIIQGRVVGVTYYLLGGIATTWAFFLARIIADSTTRRIWFGIATAHDFESHDDITEERLYQNIFASHFGQLAIIFLWTSENLLHVAWQGNFESWVQDPLHVRPIAHEIWDPHFGQPAVEAFTRGGALGPVNIAFTGVYQWWYTIGLRTNEDLYTVALFLLFLSAISFIEGLFGVSSLAWTGHLVHVAIPASRGEYVRWNNFLDVLPHPQGLGPLFTGQWNLYAQNPDSSSHLFGTTEGAGTAILTLLGGFHPQTQSLWLTDMAHHHLAIAFIFLVAGHMYRTNFGIGHSMKDLLDAYIPPGGRLGRGHKGLYDTINNSLHFQLGLDLASLGVITSLVAQHMYSLPAYAFIAKDFTTQAALYTHHQYIAGFIMTGAFAHGAIFFIRDYNPEQNEDNVLARMLDHK
ncbi:hypothetical protein MTR67_048421 [Solanum verrucosum]|uniref:photosystem I n=1 Tax=Solanum verrucosum TaxID=315347 RepID=A0AAF0ZXD1_SOLVR|nr:hypothetical protein MTR67_048421 [Solanum verrucosum]